MAGTRASTGTVSAGVITLQITTSTPFVEIVNSGTAVVGAVAQQGSAPADPALGGDDVDHIPAGGKLVIPAAGQNFDQGVGGVQPATYVKVVAAGSSGLVTARVALTL